MTHNGHRTLGSTAVTTIIRRNYFIHSIHEQFYLPPSLLNSQISHHYFCHFALYYYEVGSERSGAAEYSLNSFAPKTHPVALNFTAILKFYFVRSQTNCSYLLTRNSSHKQTKIRTPLTSKTFVPAN